MAAPPCFIDQSDTAPLALQEEGVDHRDRWKGLRALRTVATPRHGPLRFVQIHIRFE